MALQQWLLLLGWFALLAAGVGLLQRSTVAAVFSLAAAVTFAALATVRALHWL